MISRALISKSGVTHAGLGQHMHILQIENLADW